MNRRFNQILRRSLLASGWTMAPLCLGLIAALLLVLVQFFRELAHDFAGLAQMTETDVLVGVLKLIDLVLIANLVVMIVVGGVEIFLPAAAHRLETEQHATDAVDIAELKPRVFASISAIAAVDLLETYVNIEQYDGKTVLWQIAILLTFVVSGLLLAWMERLTAGRHRREE